MLQDLATHNINKKVILITGGSGGIGRATVLKFARNGYQTYASTRNLDSPAIKELQKISESEGISIIPVYLDLEKPDSIEQAINKIIKNEGRIDILINNAASGYFSSIEDIDRDVFLLQMEVNVLGVVQIIQNVLPNMRKQESGKIINVSSTLGFSTAPLNAPYSSSKYALESISETLALEVKPFGIDVVIVQPGDFHSGFIKNSIHQEYTKASPYYKLYKRSDDKINNQSIGRDPEIFADKVFKICESENPGLRYMIGKEVFIKKALHLLLPGNLWIKFLRFFYKW